MRRFLIGLMAVLPLALAPAGAIAHDNGDGEGGGQHGAFVAVTGTVVSVDATNGTFVADAYVVPAGGHDQSESGHVGLSSLGSLGGLGGLGGGPGLFGHSADSSGPAPTTTQMTITTDANTKFRVNEADGSVSALSAGDRFFALFNGSSTDTIDTIVSNPALGVFARTPPKPHQLYAFVGTVSALDTTAGTVTVAVTRSLPSDLVPAGSDPVSFTVDAHTLVLGGNASGGLFGGSLSDVSVGDVVAGGLIGDSGLTLAQVEALPLRVLLDLPAARSGGNGPQPTATAHTKSLALKRALSLLGNKSSGATKHHKKGHHMRGKSHHVRKYAKKA